MSRLLTAAEAKNITTQVVERGDGLSFVFENDIQPFIEAAAERGRYSVDIYAALDDTEKKDLENFLLDLGYQVSIYYHIDKTKVYIRWV